MRAISSMATRHVLEDFTDAAGAAGFPELQLESTGGVDAARRVADGEKWDLIFLADDALVGLAEGGHIEAASRTPLLVSSMAAAVPTGVALRGGAALRTADDVRRILAGAARIGYSTGPSGTALKRLIEDWGLSEDLHDRLVQAPAGVPVARLLERREVVLGFQQLSELADQSGVRVLGTLPADCAIETTFSGAVSTHSSQPDVAWAMLSYFASGAMSSIRSAHHFGAAGTRSKPSREKQSS